ncbi:hypothetical protein OL548_11070 [Lysinibacillus sp. MHQ-1]|nr:hypothetical protein OL548_11070 [Lysinibacillus sp. MHQ-1]
MKKNEKESISLILDQAAKIDSIEIFQGEQPVFRAINGEAKNFVEKYPLSHVKKLSKKRTNIL